MMIFKIMAKLGFGIGITPYLGNLRQFFIFLFLIRFVLCDWLYKLKIIL
jgi:hypothetical protein